MFLTFQKTVKDLKDKTHYCEKMAPRSAKIWKYFEDVPDNYTNALCTIPNCKHPKVSRGPDNCSKSNLAVSCLG